MYQPFYLKWKLLLLFYSLFFLRRQSLDYQGVSVVVMNHPVGRALTSDWFVN